MSPKIFKSARGQDSNLRTQRWGRIYLLLYIAVNDSLKSYFSRSGGFDRFPTLAYIGAFDLVILINSQSP